MYEIGADIENRRIPPQKNKVYSNRFSISNDGRIFDSNYAWDSFHEECIRLAGKASTGNVLVADIADFFPRLYFHPLENALKNATAKKDHVKAILRLLKSWNGNVSYGIPVGQTASALLAETAIADIDSYLDSEGAVFCRYVDDFRIFCRSERDAYKWLSLLAKILFDAHGLTLQQIKTKIFSTNAYLKYLESEESDEMARINRKLKEILARQGADNYAPVEEKELDEEEIEELNEIDLPGLLKEQVFAGENMDFALTRIILRRLGQTGNNEAVEFTVDNIERLYPVFKDAMRYLQDLSSIDAKVKSKIGAKLLSTMKTSFCTDLEFHRMWLLYTFTEPEGWNNVDKLRRFYDLSLDEFSKRKTILALGAAGASDWFAAKRKDIDNMSPWVKRSFLAGASCMPEDAARHWYKSVRPKCDELERLVIDWAEQTKPKKYHFS
ncbi:MAG: RNA-directed DNA polymerase [Nitrospira sp.]